MENGYAFGVGSSARIGSSNIWRNNARSMGAFSMSACEEDDEEDIKWAAIERLPNYRRVRRGILTEDEEEDNERFLLKLKERIDRVGLDMPTIEVRFEHLNVEAEAYVGSRALPTILNFSTNAPEGLLSYLHILPSRKKTLPILNDINGIIRPRRASKLRQDHITIGVGQKARVTYNGHGMKEFVPERTSAYISQYDVHIGEMTVRETLAFSARCQGVGPRYDMLKELSRREKEANIKPDPDIDIYMKAAALEGQEANVLQIIFSRYILGLDVCADTMVGLGDEMRRGISGGQKKRVTTGEMQVGPTRALFMDEISTGLDSSTMFQIVNSLRQSVHILNGTALISLLQPAPETYDLFDDIILLSDGQIVYQGPRENVLEFFEYMGFQCPERKGVADLQESFHIGQKIGDDLAVPFEKSKSHPAALTKEKYGVSKKELLKACVSREYLLMKRNLFVYVFKIFQPFIMYNGVAELTLTILKLPVFYKQRGLLFFPSWAYSLPAWILKTPVSLLEVTIWVCMSYYVIGFNPSVGSEMATGLFRLMGGLGRNIIVANTCGAFAMLVVLVMGGFILSRESVNGGRTNASARSLSAKVESFNEANHKRKRGMVLPFEPLSMSFDEIKYAVGMPQEMKAQGISEERLELLKGVSGAFRPGVLTALLGVSCAGKTTLMDVLVGRKTGGYVEGTVKISGYPKKQETFARISGYCEQTDIHSPHVTVYDSLVFSAWLRLPREVNSETRKMFIEEVMELVELTPLKEALVGLPGVNGLSTEQRKRLTIAVELVANPSIIFMDEPTSGLDARTAAIVMRTVRNTVDTGRIVVCTIHQPSIDIFDAFDENKVTGRFEFNGFYVCCCSLYRMSKCFIGSTGRGSRKDGVLSRKTSRDVFSTTICIWTGNIAVVFQDSRTWTFYRATNKSRPWKQADGYHLLFQAVIELPYILVQTVIYGVIVTLLASFHLPSLHFGIFSPGSSSPERGFLCGGDDITGFAPFLGACMD
ncbi:hypothetical protein V6N12_018165 [Hibiscus sabdariffa]|uniref:ABC transporter domain-containing protein n=1 Tax=Hibiscus sabdariffa TaxID=183260 RepID=A0ABR2BPK3_9ROSI